MDRPAKRRKIFPTVQVPSKLEADSMKDGPQIQHSLLGNKDALDQHLIHAAISDIPRAAVPSAHKSSPLVSSHERSKAERLHPRNFISYRDADDVASPAVQPVATAVASFINVVLDQGGSSVGNVLVPAESTIFNVGGYGPITINKNPPAIATPAPQRENSEPAQTPAASRPHRHSHAAQQTSQSASSPNRQAEPTAAASQNAPVQQSPMSIEVPGSSSQVILSSPPTPLPPSNASSTATFSDSYFGSTSSETTSTTQPLSVPGTTTSQPAITSQTPPISNGGFGPNRGNLTTSAVTASQTSSGLITLPIIVTSSSNSTTVISTSFSTFLTTSGASTSTLSSSTSTGGISSSSTTSSLASSTTSSSSNAASASSNGEGSGVVGGFGGPTGTAGGTPSSSSTAAAGSGDGATAPTPTIVGSVVGSVAGLALILILLLFFLRRRKRLGQQRTISPPVPQSASTGPGANTGTMTERSSAAVPLAGAGATFFRRLRPGSGATATTTETTPSERGFQNLGGRRLESVLSSQGDGFGNVPFGAASAAGAPGSSSSRGQPPPATPIVTSAPGAPGHASAESLDGSSFYRDSQGFYGGPGQPPQSAEPPSNSSSMFVGPASPPQSPTNPSLATSPEGVAVMRPGPARTPITTQPGLSPIRGSPRQQQRGTPPPPHIPGTIQERTRDGLGRSHPSLDGSRSSRFAENI